MNHPHLKLLAAIAGIAPLIAGGCSEPVDGGLAEESVDQKTEVTVLLASDYAGAWPAGLDPATNTTARANLSMMNAIFGGLFQLVADDNGRNARVIGVLASGYDLRDDGRTLAIHLREGVLFSDGTPLDAEAVLFNVERNLRSPCTCAPTAWPWVAERPITIIDRDTVELHFTRPYAAVINAFPISNINWLVSPTALQNIGDEEFRVRPVGAGPFRVVSNVFSSRLELERNPQYWREGRPHLDRLVFQAIASEQAALQALLSGDAHLYEGMTATPVIAQAQQRAELVVTTQPPTAPYIVQLNTKRPPFDDIRAREAIYYATDVASIQKGLFADWYPVSQTFTGPGGLFHHPQIPGYRQYDIHHARSLVKEIGGIRIKLGTLKSFVAEQIVTALQTQWQEAGMDVSIETYELATMIREFQSGEWRAMLQTAGSYDPESSGGVSFRFRSDQPYSGVRDEVLDSILAQAASTLDLSERDLLYQQAGKHISDNAYAPFLLAFSPTQISVRGLKGPGVTTKIPPLLVNTGVIWEDVTLEAN